MSPSEAEEVDFTQSQEPIPQVVREEKQSPSTDQVVASIPSKLLQEFFSQSCNDGPTQPSVWPGHTLFYSQAIDSSSLLNIPRVQYVWYQWKSLHGIRDTFEMWYIIDIGQI